MGIKQHMWKRLKMVDLSPDIRDIKEPVKNQRAQFYQNSEKEV